MTSARTSMIDGQLRTNKVKNLAVLDALAAIPRENFVPEAYKGIAYVDEDLKISEGRCLMEPMVLARLLESAEIASTDTALVVACGTGYSACVMGSICSAVTGVEPDAGLIEQGQAQAAELELFNVSLETSALGSSVEGAFSLVLIDGAVQDAEAAASAYAPNMTADARVIVVERTNPMVPGNALLMTKAGEGWSKRILFDASLPVLPEYKVEKGFEF